MSYPRIIAHRCGGGLAAENSLAGLAAAARIGCRGVEFDVMLSADGVPVLMHDETVDRTTDGRGAVAQLPLARLRAIDLGGEPVPLLAEAVDRCRELGLWANIELKPTPGTDQETAQVVARLLLDRWDGRGVVSSFSDAALTRFRREAPGMPVALLFPRLPGDWLPRARALGAVAVHCAARHASAAVVARVRAEGFELACYTVNGRRAGDALRVAGASAIFTDRPELWRPEEM